MDLVIASLAMTEQRRGQVLFTEPYYASGVGLLTRKESPLKAWAELRQRKVCTIEGAGYEERALRPGNRVVALPGHAGTLRRCATSAKAWPMTIPALAARLADPEWGSDFHLPAPPLAVMPWAIGLRRDDQAFKALLDPILLDMEASGYIVALEAKWRLPASAYARDRQAKAKKPPGKMSKRQRPHLCALDTAARPRDAGASPPVPSPPAES